MVLCDKFWFWLFELFVYYWRVVIMIYIGIILVWFWVWDIYVWLNGFFVVYFKNFCFYICVFVVILYIVCLIGKRYVVMLVGDCDGGREWFVKGGVFFWEKRFWYLWRDKYLRKREGLGDINCCCGRRLGMWLFVLIF